MLINHKKICWVKLPINTVVGVEPLGYLKPNQILPVKLRRKQYYQLMFGISRE
jgi:hypothetical protein